MTIKEFKQLWYKQIQLGQPDAFQLQGFKAKMYLIDELNYMDEVLKDEPKKD